MVFVNPFLYQSLTYTRSIVPLSPPLSPWICHVFLWGFLTNNLTGWDLDDSRFINKAYQNVGNFMDFQILIRRKIALLMFMSLCCKIPSGPFSHSGSHICCGLPVYYISSKSVISYRDMQRMVDSEHYISVSLLSFWIIIRVWITEMSLNE